MGKKTILFAEQFNPRNNIGGIEKFISTLSSGIAGEYDIKCAYAQDKAGTLRLPKTILFPVLAAKMMGSCDLIHANWWTGAAALPRKYVRKVPILTTMHGTSHGMLTGEMGKRISVGKRLVLQESLAYERLGCGCSDLIAAVSEGVRREIISGYGTAGDKVLTIPNGIDTDFFKPLPKEERKTVAVGVVGRMDSVEKGFTHISDAFAAARRENPGIELHIVGRAGVVPEGARVLNVQAQEMPRAYGSMDVFVQASLYEGFGLALLEAMACGIPVMSTPTGIASEIIKDGKNGFLVPFGHSGAIAEKIGLLAKDADLRQRMGREARKTAESFSLDKMVSGYLKLYERLL